MDSLNLYFKNKFQKIDNGVSIIKENDSYASNFGKQWKKYRDVQVDSKNNFNISKEFLEKIIFNDLNILKNKSILEIGCGAGRFTEYLVKESKICVSVDLSEAIFYNIAKKNKNLFLIKSDLMDLIAKEKFDIVICRGVIQHTPNPLDTILKLHEFVNKNGNVFFDIYPMPKIGMLHPKYLIWRPFIRKFFKYESFEKFITNNIKKLLISKRIIKKIFFNSDFFSDSFVPIWDYKNKINLSEENLEKWAILDTLDGIYAENDKPQSHKKIKKFLKKNKIKVINSNKLLNCFKTKL